ncbi:MAG: hypothetical protein ACR2IE_14975 [Candidatus Sumerlaeaceae bacterium]
MLNRIVPPIGFALICLLVCSGSLLHRSLWIDELVTYDIARLPFYKTGFLGNARPFGHSILGYALQDPGPGPLMYLLDGMFAKLARPMGGEFWLRLPGIAAGALSCALLFAWLRRRAGFFGASISALGAALLPLLIEFYTGARGYAWLVLISIVQWRLIWAVMQERTHSVRVHLLFVGASTIGMLVNPMHTLWTGCLLIALLVLRGMRSQQGRGSGSVLILLITTAVLHGAYIALWFYAMKASGAGTAATVRGNVELSYILRRMLEQKPVLQLLLINTALALPLLFVRRTPARFQGLLGLCTTLGSVLLLAVLCSRFFAAPRYFYALVLCSIISAGFLVQRAFNFMRLRGSRSASQVALLVCSVLVVTVLVGPARNRAKTPLQDWWGAAEYLREHAGPNDIVLTGPNSEYEVYRLYANTAGVKAQAPLLVEDATRKQHHLDRADGLGMLLERGRAVWFVTAAFGQHRTLEYWQLLRANFDEAARIPGRTDLVIYRKR